MLFLEVGLKFVDFVIEDFKQFYPFLQYLTL